jgi:hypothetical protein
MFFDLIGTVERLGVDTEEASQTFIPSRILREGERRRKKKIERVKETYQILIPSFFLFRKKYMCIQKWPRQCPSGHNTKGCITQFVVPSMFAYGDSELQGYP